MAHANRIKNVGYLFVIDAAACVSLRRGGGGTEDRRQSPSAGLKLVIKPTLGECLVSAGRIDSGDKVAVSDRVKSPPTPRATI